MHPKHYFNSFIILFSLLALVACDKCDCGGNPYRSELEYNSINVVSIDNSDRHTSFLNSRDSIPRKAIALKIELEDTVYREWTVVETTSNTSCRNSWGVPVELHCDWFGPIYHLTNKMAAIRVITRYDYSEEYPAGTEITDLFLAYYNTHEFETVGLYCEIDSAINHFNTSPWARDPIELYLALANAVQADSLLFDVAIEFEDNSELATQSEVIYPI